MEECRTNQQCSSQTLGFSSKIDYKSQQQIKTLKCKNPSKFYKCFCFLQKMTFIDLFIRFKESNNRTKDKNGKYEVLLLSIMHAKKAIFQPPNVLR